MTVSQKAARLAISCVRDLLGLRFLHQFYDAGQEAVRARMFDLDRNGAFAIDGAANDGIALLLRYGY
jgi:hypothetical protein